MPIQSGNDIYDSFSAGRYKRTDFNKITGAAAYTAGRDYEMFSLGGYPVPTTFPGTALAFVNTDDASGDGTNKFGIPHGGNVSTAIKQLFKMGLLTTSSTGIPATAKLVDLIGYWPGINMNVSTLQTLTGTPTLTRAPSGAGLRMALAARATTGATAHTLSYSYTNQAGTTGRVNPFTVACTASAIVPHIVHSGTAANNYGPELPLASGDDGVQNIASVQLSAASGSGTAVMLLYKIIEDISISLQNVKSVNDYVNQFPSGVQIPDGACLGLILSAGAAVAANSTFKADLSVAWK